MRLADLPATRHQLIGTRATQVRHFFRNCTVNNEADKMGKMTVYRRVHSILKCQPFRHAIQLCSASTTHQRLHLNLVEIGDNYDMRASGLHCSPRGIPGICLGGGRRHIDAEEHASLVTKNDYRSKAVPVDKH